jgi:hypothetical protein
MKSTLILLAGTLSCIVVNAQDAKKNFYCTITGFAAAEPFFSNQKQGGLTVSFPYQVTSPSGSMADSVFHSRVIHPFSALKVYILHLGADLGDKHQFAGVHFSPVLMGEGDVSKNLTFSFSYGRNLFFDWPSKSKWSKKRFVLKPSMNILYANYKGTDSKSPTYLGAIDNKDRSITFGGTTAGPTYSYTTGDWYDGGSTNTYTDSTNSLNIYYGQREWSLQPKIAIGTNPYRRWYYIEVYAACTLAVSEKGKVYFNQDDTHQIATKELNDNQLTVRYNDTPVKATPYHLNGWSAGFTMGVSF